MLFFSVIIPTYNSADKLYATLESILIQDFKNFEILIMDGLSTDDTIKIAKSFKDDRIRCFIEKDKGIYDAMNKGLLNSMGEWIYFLGSDDILANETILSKIYNFPKNNFDVIYGNAKIIGDTAWAKDGQVYDGRFTTEKLIKQNICHQAIFYNRSCFANNIGFNVDYKICADWDFNLATWSKKPFLYIDIVIADFFGGGISGNTADQIFSKDFKSKIKEYFNIDLHAKEEITDFQIQKANNINNKIKNVFKFFFNERIIKYLKRIKNLNHS